MLLAVLASLVSFVDPFIGTAGTGHCSPAATRPFAMVQPCGDTGTVGWDHCSGYMIGDRSIVGFSQTHLNGTGSTDCGDACIFPMAAESALKSDESASPGYYAVTLDGRIRAEMTSTARVAFYRFTYPKGEERFLRVAPTYLIGGGSDGRVVVTNFTTNAVSSTKLTGSTAIQSWAVPRAYHYVVEKREVGDDVLLVKVALSHRSVAGAERNLAAELPGWDFDRVRGESAAEWERALARIPFPGGSDAEKRMFYTSVYRLCFQPNLYSDVGEEPYYTTFSLWDTYRAANSLYAEYFPDYNAAFVKSLLKLGAELGHMPIFGLNGGDSQWMIGTHSIPVVVDGFLRGVKGVDWEAAYSLIKDSLTRDHGLRKENWALLGKYGYYPCDIVTGESVSRLLEGSFDDWCAAKMAEKLGRAEDAAFFFRRAENWRRVFDPSIGFVRGRTSDGGWRTPYDPRAVGHNTDTANDFTEGNAYQWTWHVLQDPTGLIEAMGGRAAAEKRLDELFAADSRLTGGDPAVDVTGLIGQYAHGNEPSHHIVFLYTLCGRPDKTASLVERIRRDFYIPTPDGLSGNDDCGQMSAWYIYSTLGRYPVTPCSAAEMVRWR